MVKAIKIVVHNDGDHHHHHPGSDVKGEVVVTLDEPKEYSKLTVKLIGEAEVTWTVVTGVGDERTETEYNNKVKYIKKRDVLWTKESSELTAGENSFPFTIKLPKDAAPSFKGQHGEVEYKIKAKLTEGKDTKHKAKKVHVTVAEDGADLMRSCMEPQTFDKDAQVRLLCFNFGTMSMICKLPRTGFSPGEAIPIDVHVENQSTKIVNIQAILLRKDTFTSKQGRRKYLRNELTSIDSPPIQPGEITDFEGKSVQISRDVPPTMKSCSCISVEYTLVINADVPWAPDVSIKIPIAIYIQ